MVASPNVSFGGTDPLINVLAGLQGQTDELGRQTKYPFSVSHSGVPDFTILPNPNGTNALITIYDGSGNPLFASDAVAGYGVATPNAVVPMYVFDPPNMGTTSGTFTPIWTGQFQPSNPGVQASALLKLVVSTAAVMQCRWHHYSTSGFSTYSTVTELDAAGAGTYFANTAIQTTLIPPTEMGVQTIVALEACLVSGTGTAYAVPNFYLGASGFYVNATGGWS